MFPAIRIGSSPAFALNASDSSFNPSICFREPPRGKRGASDDLRQRPRQSEESVGAVGTRRSGRPYQSFGQRADGLLSDKLWIITESDPDRYHPLVTRRVLS